jgi:hypothetical protein
MGVNPGALTTPSFIIEVVLVEEEDDEVYEASELSLEL